MTYSHLMAVVGEMMRKARRMADMMPGPTCLTVITRLAAVCSPRYSGTANTPRH